MTAPSPIYKANMISICQENDIVWATYYNPCLLHAHKKVGTTCAFHHSNDHAYHLHELHCMSNTPLYEIGRYCCHPIDVPSKHQKSIQIPMTTKSIQCQVMTIECLQVYNGLEPIFVACTNPQRWIHHAFLEEEYHVQKCSYGSQAPLQDIH